MKSSRMILLSLGVALFGLLLVYSYIYKKEQAILAGATPVNVLVAIKDLPEGVMLDETMVEVRQTPKNFVQPGALDEVEFVVGRALAFPVLAGTQLLDSMLQPETGQGVAMKIPKDKRALSIAVNDVTAVAGLINPGDAVDLLFTAQVGEVLQGQVVGKEHITRTLLQDVLVLAVNRESTVGGAQRQVIRQKSEGTLFAGDSARTQTAQRSGVRTLTLALSPMDAQRVVLAQEIGAVTVALRSSFEAAPEAPPHSLSSYEVLGVERPVAPMARPAWTMIRGSNIE